MRHDIQFLRGFAVLAVLFFHANITPVRGGYLGVDIFFVISGYLITSIILRDIDSGTFSFSSFYLRRAKRLLPAAYSTLIFATLLSYAFLTASQRDDYIKQLSGKREYMRESPADRTEAAIVAAWEREFEALKARLGASPRVAGRRRAEDRLAAGGSGGRCQPGWDATGAVDLHLGRRGGAG